MKEYKAKNGNVQYMPSLEEVEDMDDNIEGWCLGCSETQSGVEPDARRLVCDSCGLAKVFGPDSLAERGLVY